MIERCATTIVSKRSETEEVDLSSGSGKGVLLLMALCGQTLSAAAQTSEVQTLVSSSKVVLELFTSQGCSSCPSADALLQSYTKRDDVIALSVPVDYWDRLGWKDTFASPQFSLSQREYASTRGDGQVYTPQIVVGGAIFHVVGSSLVEHRWSHRCCETGAQRGSSFCATGLGGRHPCRASWVCTSRRRSCEHTVACRRCSGLWDRGHRGGAKTPIEP